MTAADRAARAAGALLGLACGDAAGVPYEFASAPFDPVLGPQMIGGGLGPYAPGEWSDDTQMALCIARAALEAPLDTPAGLDAVAVAFLDWIDQGASDVGTQTRAVLGALRADDRRPGLGRRMAEAAAALHQRTGRTAGNGALMRTAPVALIFPEDPQRTARTARAVAELTHADPLAGDSCVLWCAALRRTVVTGERGRPEDGLPLLAPERRAAWRPLEDGSWRGSDLSPNGFTVTALLAAQYAVDAADAAGDPARRFRDGISAAVGLGDDTDTIAAIAGSLLGAQVGDEGIPSEWTAAVHGWPGLRAEELRETGHRLATAEADRS